MKLSKSLTTVTPFSKICALALFIILPYFAFLFGLNYQKNLTNSEVKTNMKTNQTTNSSWKTVVNSKYGYSISYPATWSYSYITVSPEKQNNLAIFETRTRKNLTFNTQLQTIYYFYIDVYNNQTDLKELVKLKEIGDTQQEDTTIFGLPAIKSYYKGSYQAPSSVSIYFIHKNKGYRLTYLLLATDMSSDTQITPDILSTFKFIN